MNELVKITERDGRKVVSAKELYDKLGFAPQHWAKWYSKNIIMNTFAVENEDYVELPLSGRSPDFALTLDFAKKLSMLARTEAGEKIRDYFVAVEKVAVAKLDPEEMLLQAVQLMVDQKKKLSSVESRVKAIEDRPVVNAPMEYFAIMGHCRNIGRQISLEEAKVYGIKCRAMCRELGMFIGTTPDPRFGHVNTYPLDVLKSIIK